MESYPKYDYLDIQQSFFIWHRSDKGYFWDEEAMAGGLFAATKNGKPFFLEEFPLSHEKRKKIEKEKGLPPSPFLLPLPETEGYYPYKPLEENPTLFLEFAETTPTRKGILEFANKYGMLLPNGETQVFSEAYRLREGEKPPKWVLGTDGLLKDRENNKYAMVFGESLRFWQNEIQDMAFAVNVWEALKNEDLEFLKRVILWHAENEVVSVVKTNIPKLVLLNRFHNAADVSKVTESKETLRAIHDSLPTKEDVPLRVQLSYIAARDYKKELFSRFVVGDLLLPARCYIQAAINEKLKKYVVKPRLLLDEKNQLKPYLMPESLLAAMWYQFYLTVVGERQFKRCSVCGRWEDITDKTVAWTKHETCANKERVKKYREAVREALKLYKEGKTIEEIAEELGKSIEWVRKQVGKTKTFPKRGKI